MSFGLEERYRLYNRNNCAPSNPKIPPDARMNIFMGHNKIRENISENARKEKIMMKEKRPSCFQ